VQRLRVELRRFEALSRCALTAEGQHVGRDVASVDIEPRLEPGHEQPPRTASDVESGLSGFDEPAEIVGLGAAEIELCPPSRNEPVVPGLRLFVCNSSGHQPDLFSFPWRLAYCSPRPNTQRPAGIETMPMSRSGQSSSHMAVRP
jgi:hypothetical protein